jgi:L-fuculose-phosphate aldolase
MAAFGFLSPAHDQVEERALRKSVLETARLMSKRGLSPGRSGNVSARFGAGMLITPTGLAYDVMTGDDIVLVGSEGEVLDGQRAPSSEWRFHLSAYGARPDRDAIVHTHSLFATVLACAHKPIPAFSYMVAVAGGIDIPVVPYATFGTAELSAFVAAGLKERDACLLANHGQIAIARDLEGALELAHEVENLAQQYCHVLQLGSAHILSESEMAVVLEKFKSYGQRGQV